MKNLRKILFGITTLTVLGLSAMVVQAGGWDNFKLRYFYLTQYLHDQSQEIEDLRAQNLNPSATLRVDGERSRTVNIEANSRIDLTQLLNGGPPKDGIPSIDNPQFDTPTTTPFFADETIIGVVVNGEAKAYPYGILNWHEIVNDTIGGMNITVSYCPLCDTMVVFERENRTFGVSGKLYQSCLVMYDRSDDTLYSQPWALGIVGNQVNRSLERIPAVKTTLGNWLKQHPNSKILSTNTGYQRDYQRYPYGSYFTDERLVFPVRNQQQLNFHPKKIVSYIWEADQQTPHNRFSGESYAFVHEEIQKVGEKMINYNGRKIRAVWDTQLQTVIVQEMDGTVIPSSTAFAFVYPAFMGEN